MKRLPLLLVLALILACVLRFYKLGELPVSLFGDEIDVGYQSLSIATTLKSYTGQFLPVYMQSVAESRAPLLMYAVAPFVALFGPNNFGVRFAPAIFGILGVLAIYLFSKTIFGIEKKRVLAGEIAAILLAVSYWHIQYSRAAFESTLLLLLLLVGFSGFVGFLLTGKKQFTYLWPALALSFYTYSTATLFVPFLVLVTVLIYRPKLKLDKKIIPGAFLTLLMLLPIGLQIVSGHAADRFKSISIFSDQKVTDAVVLSRIQPWVNPEVDRIFHNRPIELLARFSQNYFAAFSPTFLFTSGDTQLRHSVPGFGQLPAVFAVLIIAGIYKLCRRFEKGDRLILAWLLLSPIPSALTVDGGNHATRLILMVPPLVILAGMGAEVLLTTFGRKISLVLAAILVAILSWQILAYWYQYADIYRYQSARSWHYGYQEVMPKIANYDTGQNRIFINNTHEPSLLRFAFYTKMAPAKFQEQFTGDKIVDQIIPGFNGFRLGGRYYFGRAQTLENMLELLQRGDLYLAVQGEEVPGDWDWTKTPPEGIEVLFSTRDIWGQPYMYLVTRK